MRKSGEVLSFLFFSILSVSLSYAANLDVRVVGGDEVEPHSLPFVAAIRTIIDGEEILCAGSLISENVVLTAARCVEGAPEATVILGAHNLDEEENGRITVTSDTILIHEEYNSTANINDIALIKLPQHVVLTDTITTIKIPDLSDILNEFYLQVGVVSGWGKANDTLNEYSKVLRKMQVTIIGNITCNISYLLQIHGSQMCTSGTMAQGVCVGDSGAPLVVDGVQVGIALHGGPFECGFGFPSVYTRLTSYILWIQANKNF